MRFRSFNEKACLVTSTPTGGPSFEFRGTPACAFGIADYTARVRIFLGAVFFGAWMAVQASGSTNAVEPVVAVTVSNCLQHIDAMILRIELLHDANSNSTTRVRCIADKLTKARHVRELVQGLSASMEANQADVDAEGVANDAGLILAACSRIDKLVEDAIACKASAKPKGRRPTSMVGTSTNVVDPKVSPASGRLGVGGRDVTTCITQAKFAALLSAAMGIETGGAADGPSRELSRRAIEPLGGWNLGECLNVDDFCVVVARALNLRVEMPDDPYSYVQAVRHDGLPVDSVLPRRPRGVEPALLLEAEVRLFLARGYAVQFPSGRKANP
jgi:hypothetical protein